MAMRMTGMMSGMDTESIIQELVAARQKKVDVQRKAQTKLDWKQEAWKELNTKLKRLQTKYIANMRFTDAYVKKTTKVSNSNAVSVITGENAMNGVQTMTVDQLAKSGYLTGGEITGKDGQEVTALSKVSSINPDAVGGTFTVKNGDNSVDITINENTTISDVLNQIKSVGLNANFDAKQKRFYITASKSGEKDDFSITASNGAGIKALNSLGLLTQDDEASVKEYELYKAYLVDDPEATKTINARIDKEVAAKEAADLERYKSLKASQEAAKDAVDAIKTKYPALDSDEKIDAAITKYDKDLADKEAEIKAAREAGASEDDIKKLEDDAVAIRAQKAEAQTLKDYNANEKQLKEIQNHVKIEEVDGVYKVTDNSVLKGEVKAVHKAKAAAAQDAMDALASGTAKKVSGQDAQITLNGAVYTNNNNTFEINGLTITALTECQEEITVTTQQDTDGIYDMVKNFLKEYNEIVNEMDKLYNADRAKGYEPLTDDEKDAMTEKEIEKWETKVKESLLRRDDNLSTVNSALQSVMASGFNVNGKTMYLYDFGIETLGYFESADNEKHAYHIAGDPDDEYTSSSADKLKSMISNDPDTVVSFFSQLSRGLYEKMTDLSKSVEGYRSFGNFYDDKKMKSDYDSYTKKIAEMETKLNEYEDKWYKKFSKMETALAKMQSNMSAVTGLLGG